MTDKLLLNLAQVVNPQDFIDLTRHYGNNVCGLVWPENIYEIHQFKKDPLSVYEFAVGAIFNKYGWEGLLEFFEEIVVAFPLDQRSLLIELFSRYIKGKPGLGTLKGVAEKLPFQKFTGNKPNLSVPKPKPVPTLEETASSLVLKIVEEYQRGARRYRIKGEISRQAVDLAVSCLNCYEIAGEVKVYNSETKYQITEIELRPIGNRKIDEDNSEAEKIARELADLKFKGYRASSRKSGDFDQAVVEIVRKILLENYNLVLSDWRGSGGYSGTSLEMVAYTKTEISQQEAKKAEEERLQTEKEQAKLSFEQRVEKLVIEAGNNPVKARELEQELSSDRRNVVFLYVQSSINRDYRSGVTLIDNILRLDKKIKPEYLNYARILKENLLRTQRSSGESIVGILRQNLPDLT